MRITTLHKLMLCNLAWAALTIPTVAHAATTVTGTVFIVTKGQQVIRLPLVHIFVVAESELVRIRNIQLNIAKTHVQKMQPAISELNEKIAALRSEVQPVRKKADILETEAKQPYHDCMKEPETTYSQCNLFVNNEKLAEARELRESVIGLEKELSQTSTEVGKLTEEQRRYYSVDLLYRTVKKQAQVINSIQSDVEGNFNLSIPTGKRVAILASSTREIMGKTEFYDWMIWAPQSGAKVKISLANDNMIHSGCLNCVSIIGH